MDSPFHQNFQNQPSYSSFQAQSQQNDEPIDFEKMIEVMTQVKITYNQKIDIMVNAVYSHPLTILNIATILLGPKNHVVLEAKLQFHHTHLNMTKIKILRTTFWQVIPFLKLNSNMIAILNLNFVIQFHCLTQ